MDYSVMYNRGVMWGAFHAEGLRAAIEKYGADLTRDQARMGLETIRDFGLNGFMPPMTITNKDHEGGGYIRIFQVKDHGFVPASEWMHGYRDIVQEHLAELSKLK
jgi:branched-chain amino acid transport system substrate-binding protein